MRLQVFSGLCALILAGCDDSIEGSQIWAVEQCVQQSLELQGYHFAEAEQPQQEGDRILHFQGPNLFDRSKFRLDASPRFVIDYGDVMMPWPKKAYRLRCAGDFASKTLDRIEVNDRVYQPAPGEIWHFEAEAEATSDEPNESEKPLANSN